MIEVIQSMYSDHNKLKLEINNLFFHLKKLGEKRTNFTQSRRKETIKIIAEINEIGNRSTEKIKTAKLWSFESSNKIDNIFLGWQGTEEDSVKEVILLTT